MKKIFILFLLPFLLVFVNSCDEEIIEIKTSSLENNSTYFENEETIKIENHSFRILNYKKGVDEKYSSLKIIKTETLNKNLGINISNIEISPNNSKKNWKIYTKANEFEIRNETIITKSFADIDDEETYSLFNMHTGKHLIDYTYGCLKAFIPSTKFIRYIGFTSRLNNKKLLDKYDDDVIGLLMYASSENTIQEFIIKSEVEIDGFTPDIEMVNLDDKSRLLEGNSSLYFMELSEDYKKSDIDFAFGITYYIGENSTENSMLFVVEDDRINLKSSKIDTKTFEIKEYKK